MTIKDSGNRRKFESGAVRDIEQGKGRMDLLPACALIRLSKHFEAGAKKYEERNWEKGIPISSFIDSGLRHIACYMDGKTDEDHLCAATWNLICAMWTEEKRPDMQNIPSRMEISCCNCKWLASRCFARCLTCENKNKWEAINND